MIIKEEGLPISNPSFIELDGSIQSIIYCADAVICPRISPEALAAVPNT